MNRPTWFAVEKTPTGEQAVLYYDHLPQRPRVYSVRVDTLPHARQWLAMSLGELYASYIAARDGKRLPTDPAIAAHKDKTTLQPGERLPPRWRRGGQFPEAAP